MNTTSTSNSTSTSTSTSIAGVEPFACTTCRQKKLKCDRLKAGCSRCVKLHLRCTYPSSRRKPIPRRGTTRDLESRLAQLEELLTAQDTATGLTSAVFGSRLNPEAVAQLSQSVAAAEHDHGDDGGHDDGEDPDSEDGSDASCSEEEDSFEVDMDATDDVSTDSSSRQPKPQAHPHPQSQAQPQPQPQSQTQSQNQTQSQTHQNSNNFPNTQSQSKPSQSKPSQPPPPNLPKSTFSQSVPNTSIPDPSDPQCPSVDSQALTTIARNFLFPQSPGNTAHTGQDDHQPCNLNIMNFQPALPATTPFPLSSSSHPIRAPPNGSHGGTNTSSQSIPPRTKYSADKLDEITCTKISLLVAPTFSKFTPNLHMALAEMKPPDSVIDDLHDIFFQLPMPLFGTIHRETYLKSYYSPNPSARPPQSLQYAIWAITSSHVEAYHEYTSSCYQNARHHAEIEEISREVSLSPSLANVQAWVMISIVEAKSLLLTRAGLTAAKCVRMVEMLGLHMLDQKESDSDDDEEDEDEDDDGEEGERHVEDVDEEDDVVVDMDDMDGETRPRARPRRSKNAKKKTLSSSEFIDLEQRRRVFWAVVCVDRYSALFSGWPCLIPLDFHITTRLPTSDEAYKSGRDEWAPTLDEALHGAPYSTFACSVLVAHIYVSVLYHKDHHPKKKDGLDDMDDGAFWKRHRELEEMYSSLLVYLPDQFRLPAQGLYLLCAMNINAGLQAANICLYHAAIRVIRQQGLPKHFLTSFEIRMKASASEIIELVRRQNTVGRQNSGGSRLKKHFLSLPLFAAISTYLYQAIEHPEKPLRPVDIQNYELLVTMLEATSDQHIFTQAYLDNIEEVIEAHGLTNLRKPVYDNVLRGNRIPIPISLSKIPKQKKKNKETQGKATPRTGAKPKSNLTPREARQQKAAYERFVEANARPWKTDSQSPTSSTSTQSISREHLPMGVSSGVTGNRKAMASSAKPTDLHGSSSRDGNGSAFASPDTLPENIFNSGCDVPGSRNGGDGLPFTSFRPNGSESRAAFTSQSVSTVSNTPDTPDIEFGGSMETGFIPQKQKTPPILASMPLNLPREQGSLPPLGGAYQVGLSVDQGMTDPSSVASVPSAVVGESQVFMEDIRAQHRQMLALQHFEMKRMQKRQSDFAAENMNPVQFNSFGNVPLAVHGANFFDGSMTMGGLGDTMDGGGGGPLAAGDDPLNFPSMMGMPLNTNGSGTQSTVNTNLDGVTGSGPLSAPVMPGTDPMADMLGFAGNDEMGTFFSNMQ